MSNVQWSGFQIVRRGLATVLFPYGRGCCAEELPTVQDAHCIIISWLAERREMSERRERMSV